MYLLGQPNIFLARSGEASDTAAGTQLRLTPASGGAPATASGQEQLRSPPPLQLLAAAKATAAEMEHAVAKDAKEAATQKHEEVLLMLRGLEEQTAKS